MATDGKLDTISNSRVQRALISLPITTWEAVIWVVSISSRVCLSLSPLILAAVTAGTMNISRMNSMVVTNSYIFMKLLYCMTAVVLTWATAEYMLRSVTRDRIPLKRRMIRGSLTLLEPTLISRLKTGFRIIGQHHPFFFMFRQLHEHGFQASLFPGKPVDQHIAVNQLLQQQRLILGIP